MSRWTRTTEVSRLPVKTGSPRKLPKLKGPVSRKAKGTRRKPIGDLGSKDTVKPSECTDSSRGARSSAVERFFARLKIFRRVATRYEKLIPTFAGFVWLAALMKDVL
jgi:transposase